MWASCMGCHTSWWAWPPEVIILITHMFMTDKSVLIDLCDQDYLQHSPVVKHHCDVVGVASVKVTCTCVSLRVRQGSVSAGRRGLHEPVRPGRSVPACGEGRDSAHSPPYPHNTWRTSCCCRRGRCRRHRQDHGSGMKLRLLCSRQDGGCDLSALLCGAFRRPWERRCSERWPDRRSCPSSWEDFLRPSWPPRLQVSSQVGAAAAACVLSCFHRHRNRSRT